MSTKTTILKFLGVAFLGMVAAAAFAQSGKPPMSSHMTIADPAALNGARAESVYQAIRLRIERNYRVSGDPVVSAYQSWQRYNTAPYRSSNHGERHVNNFANPIASNYGKYEKLGRMAAGAIIVKDSFVVTESGDVMTGPFFLMEKREAGFNRFSNDWLFMMIRPDGGLVGITGGEGSENVKFCAECHNKAPAGQDNLFLMPKEVRR